MYLYYAYIYGRQIDTDIFILISSVTRPNSAYMQLKDHAMKTKH